MLVKKLWTNNSVEFIFNVTDTRDLSFVKVDGQVGSGVYGTVFKATDPSTGNRLALKMIKMTKEKDGTLISLHRPRQYCIHWLIM